MFTHEKNYLKELKEAIENETYDDFMESTGKDAWEIIEDLLSVINKFDVYGEGNKNDRKT